MWDTKTPICTDTICSSDSEAETATTIYTESPRYCSANIEKVESVEHSLITILSGSSEVSYPFRNILHPSWTKAHLNLHSNEMCMTRSVLLHRFALRKHNTAGELGRHGESCSHSVHIVCHCCTLWRSKIWMWLQSESSRTINTAAAVMNDVRHASQSSQKTPTSQVGRGERAFSCILILQCWKIPIFQFA